MIGVILLLTLILSEASHRYPFLSPDDPLTASANSPLAVCVEQRPEDFSGGPMTTEDVKNRLSGFKLTGKYYCPRTLFEYGERDSFVDYVVSHVETRAKGVAQTLRIRFVEGRALSSFKPISIEVKGDDPRLVHLVKAVFINELTQILGTNLVLRGNPVEKSGNTLQIQIRRLQDPMDCLVVHFHYSDATGGLLWSSF